MTPLGKRAPVKQYIFSIISLTSTKTGILFFFLIENKKKVFFKTVGEALSATLS